MLRIFFIGEFVGCFVGALYLYVDYYISRWIDCNAIVPLNDHQFFQRHSQVNWGDPQFILNSLLSQRDAMVPICLSCAFWCGVAAVALAFVASWFNRLPDDEIDNGGDGE